MERKTPLYDYHVAAGGRMVPYAGYLLPVQYASGIVKEHMAVRTACGVFDVSHMGELMVQGPDAHVYLQRMITNSLDGMQPGRVRYSPVCNERGGIVDDLIVFKFSDDKYMLVVNAANRDKDAAWFMQHVSGDVTVRDISDDTALLALQGPRAADIMVKVSDAALLPVRNYTFVDEVPVAGRRCLVSRTGYTGEHGYEIYCAPDDVLPILERLLQAGQPLGLIPCGLGARDTLRLEAGMPLYGHEMNDDITPLETGLDMFVKMDKPDFIGKQALLDKGTPAVTRIGLEMMDRGIAREDCPVYAGGDLAGRTTSGTHCPFMQKALAMALVDRQHAVPGTELTVEVRGRRLKAKVVPLPFYKRSAQ